jgi:DNA polymerase epsilon subunit 4
MKFDPDVAIVSAEAAFLVSRATELFIQSLARESFNHSQQAKRKTLQKRDLDLALSTVDSLVFLEGVNLNW